MEELKTLDKYYAEETGEKGCGLLGIILSSRKNLCIEKDVRRAGDGAAVDAGCFRLTASFVRKKRLSDASLPYCKYFEVGNLLNVQLICSFSRNSIFMAVRNHYPWEYIT